MNEYDKMPEEPVAAEEPTEAKEAIDEREVPAATNTSFEQAAVPAPQPPQDSQPYQQAPPQYGQPYQQAPPQYGQPGQPVPPQYGQPGQQAPPQYGQPGQQVPPQYGQPYQQNYYAGQKHPADGTATAALVCGIIGLFIFGLILGIIAIVQGSRAKKLGYPGGKATAGIVLGIIDIVAWALLMASGAAFIPFM